MNRRDFLRTGSALLGAMLGAEVVSGCKGNEPASTAAGAGSTGGTSTAPQKPQTPAVDLVVAEGNEPGAMLRAGLDQLGGLGNFVKSGDKVFIKPNVGWAMKPDTAANTNPELVRELVGLCVQAGAQRVVVADNTCDAWKLCYALSGIETAVKDAGGLMLPATQEGSFAKVGVPNGVLLHEDRILREVLDADVLISLPVAKVHSQATFTANLKGLMGCVWYPQGYHAAGLHQCIADLNTYLKPRLAIVDATRVLLTNGPKGPGKVDSPGKLVLGTNPVAADAYACQFVGVQPDTVEHLRIAHQMGLGPIDVQQLTVSTVKAA